MANHLIAARLETAAAAAAAVIVASARRVAAVGNVIVLNDCARCVDALPRHLGGKLGDGEKHDGRAPDYDDWSTPNEDGYKGLNGDILIWYPVLNRSIELSSMGIRVDKEALLRQLELENKKERLNLFFHKKLMNDELPLSVGGGIGQSRLCMVLLHKAHVGEIQASIWPEEMRKECVAAGMPLI